MSDIWDHMPTRDELIQFETHRLADNGRNTVVVHQPSCLEVALSDLSGAYDGVWKATMRAMYAPWDVDVQVHYYVAQNVSQQVVTKP